MSTRKSDRPAAGGRGDRPRKSGKKHRSAAACEVRSTVKTGKGKAGRKKSSRSPKMPSADIFTSTSADRPRLGKAERQRPESLGAEAGRKKVGGKKAGGANGRGKAAKLEKSGKKRRPGRDGVEGPGRGSAIAAKSRAKPKKKCCLSKPRCKRCPLRMLAEGTLPAGFTVRHLRLVKL